MRAVDFFHAARSFLLVIGMGSLVNEYQILMIDLLCCIFLKTPFKIIFIRMLQRFRMMVGQVNIY